MIAREEILAQKRKESKTNWIALSLFLHVCALTGLFLSQRQTSLFTHTILADRAEKQTQALPHPQTQAQQTAPTTQQQPQQKQKTSLRFPKNAPAHTQVAPQKKEPKPAELQKPFVVPAPVVFYGNQAMMNAPTPIKGHKDGTSGFEHSPSALPTPPARTIGQLDESSTAPSTPDTTDSHKLISSQVSPTKQQSALDKGTENKNDHSKTNEPTPSPISQIAPQSSLTKATSNTTSPTTQETTKPNEPARGKQKLRMEPKIEKIQSREKSVSTTIQETVLVPKQEELTQDEIISEQLEELEELVSSTLAKLEESIRTLTTAPISETKQIATQQNQKVAQTKQDTKSNSQTAPSTVAKGPDEPLKQSNAQMVHSNSQQSQSGAKKNPLTLADLFKNSRQDLQTLTMQGVLSAKKAGTENGDDNGSGHQITIKEGDMKYYTLWAKFLNHLNQAARFNRRGKERLIQEWIATEKIRYVLQCGITVDLEGKVLDIEITHSSGCKKFDEFCISDIHSAVPYPPLPPSLGKTSARFEVNVYP